MYKRYYDIDVDAKAYANRIVKAGGRIPSDIANVSDFIKKLKINNLWIDILDVWLMRKDHNIGTGTTVYALKNDRYNATMSSASMVWDNTGIIKNVSTQYLSVPLVSTGGRVNRSIIGVSKKASANHEVISYGTISEVRFALRVDVAVDKVRLDAYNGSINDSFGSTNITANFNQLAASYDTNTLLFKANNLTATTSNISMSFAPSSLIFFGGWDPTQISLGLSTTSFGLISDRAFSSAQIDTFYSIMKNTIGKGLDLP
jgi:hypothetical protein